MKSLVYRVCSVQVDGKFPPSTRTLQNVGNLTIVQLTREDQGVYECLATNVVTSIITATLLVVQCTYAAIVLSHVHTESRVDARRRHKSN